MKPILPLALTASSALLASCGGVSAPRASDQPTVTMLSGQVVSGGAGSVSVPGAGSSSATVGTDGTFALALPQEAAFAGQMKTAGDVLGGLSCTGSVSSSASAARGYLMATLDSQSSAGARQLYAMKGARGTLSASISGKAWLYMDQATSLRGSVNCAGLLNSGSIKSLNVNVAVDTKPGWNVLDLNIAAGVTDLLSGSITGSAGNSTTPDANSEWRSMAELQSSLGF